MRLYKLSLLFLLLAGKTFAQPITVSSAPSSTGITLVGTKTVAAIAIDENDYPVVKLAASLFAEDVGRVTGKTLYIGAKSAPQMILAGTLGKSQLIDRLITQGKLKDIEMIKGHWEATLWQMVDDPAPGVKKALVIVGSDRRGTAYGLICLSKLIGVSPWYWWADVPVMHKNTVTISIPKPTWDKPAVKYRGIFINDEDWGINLWARNNFEKDFAQGVGPKTYEKVFELMLRLRLNYLWPAMHAVSKEFGNTPENIALADRYAIVAGSSHCEPMLYNNVHWDEKVKGRWNYSTNRDTIYNTWKNTVLDRKDKEAVWTLGIRGIHDRGMETPPSTNTDRIDLLEQVFKDQRDLIHRYVAPQYGPVAQCFVPYKEVLPVYDAGLKVPDDVTLMWVDDNFGYIRRLSNLSERKRTGGSGLYWHLSYYGAPHSYTWINTTPPALLWEEFHKAWENEARTIWVINVGDIKPMELGIDYFSRLAWDPEGQHADAQPKFLTAFLAENFSNNATTRLYELVTDFYHLGTIRKPELMNRHWALSLSPQTAQKLLSAYEDLLNREHLIAAKVPVTERDAYTELIGFPTRILAATGLIFMHDRAQILGNTPQDNPPQSNTPVGNTQQDLQHEIRRLKASLDAEVEDYNLKIAGGKWKDMMPGAVTGKNLPAWSSQVAWPWGETNQPDTARREPDPDILRIAASADHQSAPAPAVPPASGATPTAAQPAPPTPPKTARWIEVPGLGRSGRAMALEPAIPTATWDSADPSAPTLRYDFHANGKASRVILYFLPTFRLYPGMQLRVGVGVDDHLLATIEVPGSSGKEDENGLNRNQGIRNNYVTATVDLRALPAGEHSLFIRAVDPGAVIDAIGFVDTPLQQTNPRKGLSVSP